MDIISYISKHFHIDPKLVEFVFECEKEVAPVFKSFQETAQANQFRVIEAFQKNDVSARHFYASTGYGYGDEGREKLCRVFADAFGAEEAIVSPMLMSGTHAISTALFGLLRPGDTLYSLTGKPYDTLLSTLYGASGSLEEYGIRFRCAPLKNDGRIDIDAAIAGIKSDPTVKVIYLQRSTGYEIRPAFTVEALGKAIAAIRGEFPDRIIMVDNCYGEFVCTEEPTSVGADVIAGSLIKNPGGGIAPTGGYIAGRHDLVQSCAYRLTTPGLGKEVGCTMQANRELFMGAFHAPHVTGEALKTAVFASALFSLLGYDVTPRFDEPRADIIQAVMLRNEKALIAFCQGMQKGAPVDSFVVPEPWDMPGYDSQVIMAAGAFTLGASIELSADAPLREPYAAWMQGGLNFHSGKVGVLLGAQSMIDSGVLTL